MRQAVTVPNRVSFAYLAERFIALSVLLLQPSPDRPAIREIAEFLKNNRQVFLKYDTQFLQLGLPAPSSLADECQTAHALARLGRVRFALKCAKVGHLFSKQTSLTLSTENNKEIADRLKTSGFVATTPQTVLTPIGKEKLN